MADTFYDGMPNVNEKLNEMDRNFKAGPYNALPLSGGVLTGPVDSTNRMAFLAQGLPPAQGEASTVLRGPTHQKGTAPTLVASMGVGGTSALSYPGQFNWYTSSGRDLGNSDTYTARSYDMHLRVVSSANNVESGTLFMISGTGNVTAAGNVSVAGRLNTKVLQAGSYFSATDHTVANDIQTQGKINLSIVNSAVFYVSSGPGGNASACAINVGSNNTTGRSMNCGGTVNASGADYAEYFSKNSLCAAVKPGQIVGIDADGLLTDRWEQAISFAVKSTNPCMVGGDVWARHLGPRPTALVRAEGVDAAQWDAAQADFHAAELSYDAALETARLTVDRIAFAGQVPVNVYGAAPGQYIVPVADGAGVRGQAVDESELGLAQYLRAIGKVIAIEDDGRARIVVKVA